MEYTALPTSPPTAGVSLADDVEMLSGRGGRSPRSQSKEGRAAAKEAAHKAAEALQKKVADIEADHTHDNEPVTVEDRLDACIGGVIVVNSIILGLELDFDWGGFVYFEYASVSCFLIDIVARLCIRGCAYLRDISNWVDIIIVFASVIELWLVPLLSMMSKQLSGPLAHLTMILRLFRLLRAVRLLKLIKVTKPLFSLLVNMGTALKRVAWVMVLVGLCLYGWSLVFTQIIGHDMFDIYPDNGVADRFSTVARSFFELFRVMCGDVTDFGPIVSKRFNAVLVICYVVFQITTTWLLLSIFTAAVVDSTITSTAKEHREDEMRSHRQKRQLQEGTLWEIVHQLCPEGGDMSRLKIVKYMEDDDNAQILVTLLGLSTAMILHIFDSLQTNDELCPDEFVDGLLFAAAGSTQDSIMKIESQVLHLQKDVTQILGSLVGPPLIKEPIDSSALSLSNPEGERPGSKMNEERSGSKTKPRAPIKIVPAMGLREEIKELSRLIQRVVQSTESSDSSRQSPGGDFTTFSTALLQQSHEMSGAIQTTRDDLLQVHGTLRSLRESTALQIDKLEESKPDPRIDGVHRELTNLRQEFGNLAELLRKEVASQTLLSFDSTNGELSALRCEVRSIHQEILSPGGSLVASQALTKDGDGRQKLAEVQFQLAQLHGECKNVSKALASGDGSPSAKRPGEAGSVVAVAEEASLSLSRQTEAAHADEAEAAAGSGAIASPSPLYAGFGTPVTPATSGAAGRASSDASAFEGLLAEATNLAEASSHERLWATAPVVSTAQQRLAQLHGRSTTSQPNGFAPPSQALQNGQPEKSKLLWSRAAPGGLPHLASQFMAPPTQTGQSDENLRPSSASPSLGTRRS